MDQLSAARKPSVTFKQYVLAARKAARYAGRRMMSVELATPPDRLLPPVSPHRCVPPKLRLT